VLGTVLSSDKVFADETTLPVLDPDRGNQGRSALVLWWMTGLSPGTSPILRSLGCLSWISLTMSIIFLGGVRALRDGAAPL
jgi:hypothetical protein